jgi:hypothetical protein
MSYICLATEDELSEKIGIRLLQDADLIAEVKLGRRGNGYLKSKANTFSMMSRNKPVLLITDLDNHHCPIDIQEIWLGRRNTEQNFLFRVAVREIESWVLSDIEAIGRRLKSPISKIPQNTDLITHPKQFLLKMANRLPRKDRDEVVRLDGTNLRQGIGYNSFFSDFVENEWSLDRAAQYSPSLSRTRARVMQLAARLS